MNSKRQYIIAVSAVAIVAMLGYPLAGVVGYRTIALVLLLTVSLLAMQLSLYPVLTAAVLSALVWDYFFIPPHFTFTVGSPEDALMLGMYFIIALLNGVLTARIRRAEEKARQREERAKAAKLYDTLFNSLSHELRTPLATIIGASDNLMLKDSGLSEENKRRLYHEINLASERLNRLVDNLLNMSRLDSGYIQPKLDWCDLGELVYTVVNRLKKELKNHQVNVSIPENLPLVKLDFGLMEQALTNILYNAALYTPAGSAIKIEGKVFENLCVVVITDSGKGFPKEDLELVFEKFYRSKNSRTGGVGLGLSIAKGFVDAHQGSIFLENERGGGAKFTLKIPVETHPLKTLEYE
jgi:two-component system, OmpR family, sensor histidine kinase KdpD